MMDIQKKKKENIKIQAALNSIKKHYRDGNHIVAKIELDDLKTDYPHRLQELEKFDSKLFQALFMQMKKLFQEDRSQEEWLNRLNFITVAYQNSIHKNEILDFMDYATGKTSVSANDRTSINANDSGYVYALMNPSFPNLIKVGKTTRSVEERIKELSSTGVPTPFVLAHSIFVRNCTDAENYLHLLLEEKNFRVSKQREFFDAPLKLIIELMEVVKEKNGIPDESTHNEYDDNFDYGVAEEIEGTISKIEQEATEYLYGENGRLIDESKALALFEKSAKLNSASSHYQISEIYNSDNESSVVKPNLHKRIDHLIKCAELNDGFWSILSCKLLAKIYANELIDSVKCKISWEKCLVQTEEGLGFARKDKEHFVKYHKNDYYKNYADYLKDMIKMNEKIDSTLIFGDHVVDNFSDDLIEMLKQDLKNAKTLRDAFKKCLEDEFDIGNEYSTSSESKIIQQAIDYISNNNRL